MQYPAAAESRSPGLAVTSLLNLMLLPKLKPPPQPFLPVSTCAQVSESLSPSRPSKDTGNLSTIRSVLFSSMPHHLRHPGTRPPTSGAKKSAQPNQFKIPHHMPPKIPVREIDVHPANKYMSITSQAKFSYYSLISEFPVAVTVLAVNAGHRPPRCSYNYLSKQLPLSPLAHRRLNYTSHNILVECLQTSVYNTQDPREVCTGLHTRTCSVPQTEQRVLPNRSPSPLLASVIPTNALATTAAAAANCSPQPPQSIRRCADQPPG